MTHTLRKLSAGVALAVLGGLTAVAAVAAPAAAEASVTAPCPVTAPRPAPTGADVAAFLDAVVPDQLAAHGIPGAAVVVVAGGRQVFAGDDTYPGRPVTVAHLLTHTAGFDEDIVGMMTATPEHLPALGDHLAAHQPARVRPPGTLASYSNYGVALAGYLVEEVTGTPFPAYVRTHVTGPLGMTRTSFAQPLPPELAADLAVGHDADRRPIHGQYSLLSPAGGGAVTTAADLGRFMLAHLGGGTRDGARVLAEETVRLMHTRQFGHDDRLPGMAYGFIERHRNGHRLLTHAGDNLGFHGNLAMLPEQGAGIYVVYNGDGVDGGATLAGQRLVERFVDRFYPGRPASSEDAPDDGPRGRRRGGPGPVRRHLPFDPHQPPRLHQARHAVLRRDRHRRRRGSAHHLRVAVGRRPRTALAPGRAGAVRGGGRPGAAGVHGRRPGRGHGDGHLVRPHRRLRAAALVRHPGHTPAGGGRGAAGARGDGGGRPAGGSLARPRPAPLPRRGSGAGPRRAGGGRGWWRRSAGARPRCRWGSWPGWPRC